MDFLNKAYAQLSELFQSMSPGSRITAALLLAIVVISLGYLFTYQVAGPGEYLLGGEPFPSAQLQEMEAAFGAAGLSYEVESARIRIPRGQKAKYMAALVDADALPPQWGKAFDEALQNESVFLNKQQREERLKNAKQKELGMYISSMKGIRRAAVVYDTKIERGGFTRTTLNTAAVSIEPVGSAELDERRVSAIRHLVAAAVAGMKPENVTVTDLKSGITHYGSPESGGGSMGDQYGALVRRYEQHWKKKILGALAHVPGVTVTPTVELDRVKSLVTRTVKPDPKGTAMRTTEKSHSREHQGSAPAGRPGFQANQPNALPASTTKGSTETEDESEATEEMLVGGMQEEKVNQGLTPKRVTIAVGVPSSYFVDIRNERNPTPPGEEPKSPEQNQLQQIQQEEVAKIKQQVAGVLLEVEGVDDRADLVTVTTFQDITPATIPEPGMAENALTWFGQHWGTLGMIGLAMFSLVMLRSMIRAVPAGPRPQYAKVSPSTVSKEPERGSGIGIADTEEAKVKRRLERFAAGGQSLRDELSDIVKEDPDVAANILRTWIGSPGIKT